MKETSDSRFGVNRTDFGLLSTVQRFMQAKGRVDISVADRSRPTLHI